MSKRNCGLEIILGEGRHPDNCYSVDVVGIFPQGP